jgi:hypothetical protein
MSNSKEFIAANPIQFVNDANKDLIGTITSNTSGNIVFADEFTKNTNKFDKPDEKIGSLTLENLLDFPQGIEVDDTGKILFQDTTTAAYLNNIVSDIDVVQLLDKLNTIGSIYDIKIKQMTFGDYKYANVKFCTDLATTFGYFSVDKLMNDERARALFTNEQAVVYSGTEKQALFPPYAGFLSDQDYLVNGWINIDHLIHMAFGNSFAFDDEASFSIRTKAFKDAKRVVIMMVLNYLNDMFTLGSFNKLSDFGVRIIDRNTDQEIDLSHVQTNIIGDIGTNILATYVGPLQYELKRLYDVNVPKVQEINVNQCDKKYINKCDGVIFTMKNEVEETDKECPVCFRHEIGVEIRVNPHADTRINKPDIQNTIDPIHWTAGLIGETCELSGQRTTQEKNSNYDVFKDLTVEFGEKPYTVGQLNESRAFAGGDGTVDAGVIAGGFAHEEDSPAVQRTSMEKWNGTSWCMLSNMPNGRSLGLFAGDEKQAVYAFGAQVTFSSEFPSSTSLKVEADTVVYNGTSWFVPSPYTFPVPNVGRHSVAGKLDIKITPTDESKNPVKTKETYQPHTLFQDNFLMKDSDYRKLSAAQNPDSKTSWYNFTRFSGIVFGGSTDTSLNLYNIPVSSIRNDFEYISWGDMLRTTVDVTGTEFVVDTKAGTWLMDPTRNYPVAAYGIKYVGDTVRGLATGGKTGKSPEELLNAYFNASEFDEFESPIVNLAYEYNGTTWIRRDNMPEEIYYHEGVGDISHSIYWGGIHGSMEEPHIYDSTETFEDWEVVISRFGGSTHQDGTYIFDGSLRYSLFPTLFEDDNMWYQNGDSRDYTDLTKPYLGTTEASGVYINYSPYNVNSISGNKHDIVITKVVDDSTIKVSTFFDGESWKSKTIRAGSGKSKAQGEDYSVVGVFANSNEKAAFKDYEANYIKNPDGSISTSFVPDGVFANRYNTEISTNPDYVGHTVIGGMWLWSRPSVGEHVFHPDNFLTKQGTDVSNPDVVNEYIKHSFDSSVLGPVTGDTTLFSFFVKYENGELDGLKQFVVGDNADNNELVFVEKWDMPEEYQSVFTATSVISSYYLKLDGDIIPAYEFDGRKSLSYGKFVNQLDDLLAVDTVTNKNEIGKFIETQFRTLDTDISANTFVYDIQKFYDWTQDTSGTNFNLVKYDGFTQYFVEEDSYQVTVGNYVKSSTIRDKASLFPWCDLLKGDASNRASKGDVTWNWVKEDANIRNENVKDTYLIVAETVFADFIPAGAYDHPDGSVKYAETEFWREVFKISKYDKKGNEVWSYEITYDENTDAPIAGDDYWITSTYPVIGTLTGTAIQERVLNDGLSTNMTVNVSGDVTLRNVKLWNSKTLSSVNDTEDVKAHEQYDMTYVDWKKVVSNDVPLIMYSEDRKSLVEMLNGEYKIPSKAISLRNTSTSASESWFLNIPSSAFSGMLIADSKLAINRHNRTVTTSSNESILYEDTSIFEQKAGPGKVKEYISSYPWQGGSKFKVVKAFFASEISDGYVARGYGKSTYDIPPVTFAPISANVDNFYIQNNAQYAYPWNYLIQDPAMFVELVDASGYWFAYGDSTNKVIESEDDTHTNVYRIGHIPSSKLDNLKTLPLGNTLYESVKGLITSGDSNAYRHKEAIIELVNTQNGCALFDVFTTIIERNEEKPYGPDVPYVSSPPLSSSLLFITSNEELDTNIPFIYCCDISITGGGGGGSFETCDIKILSNNMLTEGNDGSCLTCIEDYDTSSLPKWEQHNHEEWSVPFIESPFAGPFGNKDFNVWVSSAKSDETRWGNLVFNSIPQEGQLLANFKAHRIGIDTANNKVYLSMLTASVGINEFNSVEISGTNIPCKVWYDEYIFPTQFASGNIPASGYAALPFIEEIREKSISFNKDAGIFCTAPVFIYIPETTCSATASQYYYTEWATNFIQEFKNKTNDERDSVEHKYYFTHNVDRKHGSTTSMALPDPNSFDIIETDWRRYQDGVGFGGDIPDIEDSNCLPLNKWFVGQTAFGVPGKAVVVGGYVVNSGESSTTMNNAANWWHLYTTNKTFKWNTSVINPEDMYNRNYTKRVFSPFFNNGENTFANSSLSCVMFDIGKNVRIERNGVAKFVGDGNTVTVVIDPALPDFLTNKNLYSISLAVNDNVKVWWTDKTETGFTLHCETDDWIGEVDWSILYFEDLSKEVVEDSLEEQDTYDKFKNI